MKHLKTYCRWYLLPAFLLFICTLSTAQTESQIEKLKKKEGVEYVKPAQIRKEIANFSTFASEADKKSKNNLVHLKLSKIINNKLDFENGAVTVDMKIAPFKKSTHILNYTDYPDSKTRYVYAIDHSPYWGHDGGIPTHQFKHLIVSLGRTKINMPPKALKGLYGHKNTSFVENIKEAEKYCSVYRTADKKRYYVFMWFSDGAGAYEVTWIIENGKYLRRVVDYGY